MGGAVAGLRLWAGGWWLVAGGWWLVAGGWWCVPPPCVGGWGRRRACLVSRARRWQIPWGRMSREWMSMADGLRVRWCWLSVRGSV
ncbi:MAG: hypothetical protein E6Q92_12825 [Burkholderiaceae bacterium]|nr:MAG: hypothetical protein E6Q92_12825 [Burkholderiaceae bacterium]